MKLPYEMWTNRHVHILPCPHVDRSMWTVESTFEWSPHFSGGHMAEEATVRPGTLGYSYKSELTPIDL